MKKLVIIISLLIILTIMSSIAVTLTTNATVTNDIAIDQLNGGDDAYLAMQTYYQYRNAALTALYITSGLTITFISILIYNIIKK